MVIAEGNRPDETAAPALKVIGTRPIRHDGHDKVTGRARYSNDVQIAGTIAGKVLRSPYAHARIVRIDTSKAEAMPGVRAVVTGADMPISSGKILVHAEGYWNPKHISLNSLAYDKVLYRGHAVAAVAADTPTIAEQAIKLIEVEYEVLPPVLDGVEAMRPEAPAVNDQPPAAGSPYSSNVASSFVLDIGDVAQGFEQADVVIEHDFRTGAAHQGYIEPQAATAAWSEDGQLTIWASSQGHFNIRDLCATVLGLPAGQVKVVPSEIGGGFGAKLTPTIEPVAALLAKKAGRPVKIALSRTDVFEAVGPTSAAQVHLKMGFSNDGRIVAAEGRLVFEAGAFPGSPVGGAANCMLAPYDVPNAHLEGFDVLVNKPKVTAYRAPGAPVGAFAVETIIDEFCEQSGHDPIELRVKNAALEGTRRVNGMQMPKCGFVEGLEAARNSPHFKSPLEGPNRGRGMAAGFWGNGAGPASAIASVHSDGRVSLVEGSPDIGGTRAVAAMHVAEVLGIPAEDVRPSVGDTDSVGYTSLTGGSSVAFKTGWAAYEAAQDVKRQMIERAALLWELSAEEVSFEDGGFRNRHDDRRLTFKEVAAKLNDTGGPVMGRATVNPRGAAPAYAFHIADVEVDPDTGKVQVLRYTTVQDAGRAIHPSYVEGQMQGGASQGIGWALNEEYVYDADGRMQNSSFLDYRMPTTLDVPQIETQIVEVPNPGHPYGVRGVGEVPIVPPLAAIANAVYRATGVRFRELPISPARVLEATLGLQE